MFLRLGFFALQKLDVSALRGNIPMILKCIFIFHLLCALRTTKVQLNLKTKKILKFRLTQLQKYFTCCDISVTRKQ